MLWLPRFSIFVLLGVLPLTAAAAGDGGGAARRTAPGPAGSGQDESLSDSMELWRRAQVMLEPACEKYLATFCDAKERAKWNRKLTDRIAQRVQDGAAGSEDSIFQRLALDWAAENEGKVRRKEPKAIKEACLMFDRFIRMGIPPPWQVRQGLTLKNVREICRELEVTVAAREKGSSVEQAHKVRAE
jgi:hypothetical protein